MARLTLPGKGTVVHAEGDLEQLLRAEGWVEVEDEKPAPARAKK